jgi:hypothetical protein
MAKFLRAILIELWLFQDKPTKLYKENSAATMMANVKRPTERSPHVDIQQFAQHEWVQNKYALLEHVRVTPNPSDALMKALGWILHHQ